MSTRTQNKPIKLAITKSLHLVKRLIKRTIGSTLSSRLAKLSRSSGLSQPFTFHLEQDDSTIQERTHCLVKGWILSHAQISDLVFRDSSNSYRQKIFLNKDPSFVEAGPDKHVVAFENVGFLLSPETEGPWCIEFCLGEDNKTKHSIEVPVCLSKGHSSSFWKCKKKKSEILKKVLPERALSSGRAIKENFQIDFTGQQHLEEYFPTVSSFYDQKAKEIIQRYKDGIVLDFGSGARQEFFDNVICLDIETSPVVDVIADGHSLPFSDNTFDSVIALNVLEHVSDPFLCVSEMIRVTKPEGIIYAVAPLLAPFHGYPNHFFNMTPSGLKSLFSKGVEISEIDVYSEGRPIWGLWWILNQYYEGLPKEVAKKFEKVTVAELCSNPVFQKDLDYVTNLSDSANERLACANYIIAEKKLA